MNSIEIEKLCLKQGVKQFLGCFPSDQMPSISTNFPTCFIMNTDNSSEAGDHWLAVILNKKNCLFFDSFGLPILNPLLIQFLSKQYKKAVYSAKCIQHFESIRCGEFCVAFLKKIKTKKQYQMFLSNFNGEDLLSNDKIVANMLNSPS